MFLFSYMYTGKNTNIFDMRVKVMSSENWFYLREKERQRKREKIEQERVKK